MSLLVIKIVLIIAILYLLVKAIFMAVTAFNDTLAKYALAKINEQGIKWIKNECMCKFLNCMSWIFILLVILIAAFKGNITITHT